MNELETAYGGCEVLARCCGIEGRVPDDGIGILDRYSAYDVASHLETSAEENNEEVVRFIMEDCLVELDNHRN